MDVGVPELLIILVLVILLFGVGRIGKVAGELGSGIRAFREGLRGEEAAEPEPQPTPKAEPKLNKVDAKVESVAEHSAEEELEAAHSENHS